MGDAERERERRIDRAAAMIGGLIALAAIVVIIIWAVSTSGSIAT
jgi:hypothetical protein